MEISLENLYVDIEALIVLTSLETEWQESMFNTKLKVIAQGLICFKSSLGPG